MVAIRVRRLADIRKAMLDMVKNAMVPSWGSQLGFSRGSHILM